MKTPPSYSSSADNPSWGLLTGMVTWLSSVLLVMLVPMLILIPYLAGTSPVPLSELSLPDLMKDRPDAVFVNILAVLPAHLLTLAIAWFVVTGGGQRKFLESLGWEWGGFKWWHGVVILVSFMAVGAAVTQVIPEQEHELMRMLRSSRAVVYAVAFLATFTAPLVEEVIYRGALFAPAKRQLGDAGAVALVTVLFAAIHIPQYLPSVSTIILVTLLSLTLTVLRLKTRNLLPCVALHLVFNGLQSLRLLADPWIDSGIR